MTTDDKLPACPFCDCAIIRVFEVFERGGYRVDCNQCHGGFMKPTEAMAREAWNTRAPSDKLVAAVAALEACLADCQFNSIVVWEQVRATIAAIKETDDGN